MNILITSGGTSEKIDQVRSITNHSTGQLGKMIAERFLDAGFPVTLVTSPNGCSSKKAPPFNNVSNGKRRRTSASSKGTNYQTPSSHPCHGGFRL